MYIHLNPTEIEFAEHIAEQKEFLSRESGIKDRRVYKSKRIDFTGFAGELAFCKAMNVYPTIDPYPKQGGVDCVIRGKRIDVKTSSKDGDMMISPTKKQGTVDYFAFVVGSVPRFHIVGVIEEAKAFNPKFLKEINGSECYVIPQRELTKIA